MLQSGLVERSAAVVYEWSHNFPWYFPVFILFL